MGLAQPIKKLNDRRWHDESGNPARLCAFNLYRARAQLQALAMSLYCEVSRHFSYDNGINFLAYSYIGYLS